MIYIHKTDCLSVSNQKSVSITFAQFEQDTELKLCRLGPQDDPVTESFLITRII